MYLCVRVCIRVCVCVCKCTRFGHRLGLHRETTSAFYKGDHRPSAPSFQVSQARWGQVLRAQLTSLLSHATEQGMVSRSLNPASGLFPSWAAWILREGGVSPNIHSEGGLEGSLTLGRGQSSVGCGKVFGNDHQRIHSLFQSTPLVPQLRVHPDLWGTGFQQLWTGFWFLPGLSSQEGQKGGAGAGMLGVRRLREQSLLEVKWAPA